MSAITYAVHTLDVWGNCDDGYDVNDIYPSCGQVTCDPMGDAAVIRALVDGGYLGANSLPDTVVDDVGDPSVLYIAVAGKPMYELRRIGAQS